MDTLRSTIHDIGSRLVRCHRACAGIVIDPQTGVIPRSLYLEDGADPAALGAAVVGMNPGRPMPGELEYYRSHGCTYESVTSWFELKGRDHKYHRELRRFLTAMDHRGPILWTELAKCQSADGIPGSPPLQTYRTCTAAYLTEELGAVPATWALIGVGRDAFGALAFRFPGRPVIGVPHPTGSRGLFPAMFSGAGIAASIHASITRALNQDEAVWLGTKRTSAV